jgi:hypothetical protein
MVIYSGELDRMKKFKSESILYLLTNRLVSSAFKSIDEIVYQRYYKESQNPFLLIAGSQTHRSEPSFSIKHKFEEVPKIPKVLFHEIKTSHVRTE